MATKKQQVVDVNKNKGTDFFIFFIYFRCKILHFRLIIFPYLKQMFAATRYVCIYYLLFLMEKYPKRLDIRI